jgi:hypothetical protein
MCLRTGASRAVVFSHIVRKITYESTVEDSKTGDDMKPVNNAHPARFVHIDQPRGGAFALGDSVLADEWPELSKHRFGIVNVWRPISTVIRKDPLCVCDQRTVDPDDLVPKNIFYPENANQDGKVNTVTNNGKHQVCAVKHNPKHKWYYANEMTPEEILMIQIFDSQKGDLVSGTPHTSFIDAERENEPTRQSIETRCLCT